MFIAGKIPTLDPNRLARIGYKNLLVSANGVTVPRALIPNTYERWIDTSGTATGVFQLETTSTIDYVAIGAHNLFTSGAQPIEISTASTIGGPYMLRATITPINNQPIFYNFDTPLDNVAEIRIFTADIGTGIEIGLVYCGQALIMEQPIYGGHTPQEQAARTEYQSPLSETGQFLGRTITRKGTETSYNWQNLTPEFVRGEFAEFIESAKTLPFFIQWRPDYYPLTASLCHATADIIPDNMGGGHRLMSVSVPVRGHSDVI